MIDENKLKQTIRELLEVGGLLKTGSLELTYSEPFNNTNWLNIKIGVRPRKTTWNVALDRLPPQKPLIHRLLECMSGKDKVELFRLLYVDIKRWAEPESALTDDYREKLTAICEDTLEVLSRTHKKGQEKIDAALAVQGSISDEEAEHLEEVMRESRGYPKIEEPTPIVALNKRIEELGLEIERRSRLEEGVNHLTGYRSGLSDSLRIFMDYWKTLGSSAIYEIAGQCSCCGRVAPAHLLKPAADTGKSICLSCVDDKRKALEAGMNARAEETINQAAPWLMDPKEMDLSERIMMGKRHGGKNILVTIEEAEKVRTTFKIATDYASFRKEITDAMGREVLPRDAVVEAVRELNHRSGKRGKDLFQLKRAIRGARGQLKKMEREYEEQSSQLEFMDHSEREELGHRHGVIYGMKRVLNLLELEERRPLEGEGYKAIISAQKTILANKIPDIEAMLTKLYLCVMDLGAPNEGSNFQKHLEQLEKVALDLGLDLEEE